MRAKTYDTGSQFNLQHGTWR